MKIRPLLLFVICALVAGLTLRYGIEKFSVFGSIAGHTKPIKTSAIPAYTRSLHPNFPYSIIPGGAYSPAELRNADQEDPLVRQHYADFNLKNVHMVQLTDDRYQYVSYRLKKKVYWTKKKLRIPKGEVLLTDGGSWARARCGNRLSDSPHREVSDQEPPAKVLSLPPMQLGTPMELAEAPPLGELAAIPPINIERFPPVLPPSGVTVPPELPPLVPAFPIIPSAPGVPPIFGPPPTTPQTPPTTPPPINPPSGPPVIPPPGPPPVTPVPEPNAIYLFLVTFVLSLYGLTRMMPPQEKTEVSDSGDDTTA